MWKRLAGGKQHPNSYHCVAHWHITGFRRRANSRHRVRVGVTQISWLPILIDASADRHFNRDMAW